MKARIMISDGAHAAIAILHTAIYEKLVSNFKLLGLSGVVGITRKLRAKVV